MTNTNSIKAYCTRIPTKICEWNPITFSEMFTNLSLESRKMQTQNCVPIQRKVLSRLLLVAYFIHFFKLKDFSSQKGKFKFERLGFVCLIIIAMKFLLVDTFSGFQTFVLVERSPVKLDEKLDGYFTTVVFDLIGARSLKK